MENHLFEGLFWYFAFILSVVVHEASHALAALKLGDPTAHLGGQVTLNPVPHMKREPVGTIVVPIISFLLGGWMFGWASAPYDRDWARRHPGRSGLMALAGPAANLVLVLLAAALIRAGIYFQRFYPPDTVNFSRITASYSDGTWAALAAMVSIVFTLNLILLVFNLLPVPPLDGSGIVPLFLPRDRALRYMEFLDRNPMLFIGIIVAWNVFDYIFGPMHLAAINLLYPGANYR
jgi:Zn-dependent protease